MATSTIRNGSKIVFRSFCVMAGYLAEALKAFLSIPQITIRLIGLVPLHAVTFVGLVTSDNAASRCSQ
jgi:hypothetical protein